VRYDNGGMPKRVDYWVATVAAAQQDFEPTSEIDEVVWLAANRASRWLTYQRDVETLAEFVAGPRRTVPLILLRHASAGSKSDWPKSDVSRPLDGRGTEDALTLARVLPCFGAGRVVSAPAERCVATVRPYAASIGSVIEIEPTFDVGAGSEPDADGTGPGSAASAAMARLAAADQPVVVCAHRENLPMLLDAACAALRTENPDAKPLRKGEFAVLHRAAGILAALERYHPAEDYLVADAHSPALETSALEPAALEPSSAESPATESSAA